MSDDLERRVRELEARVSALAMATAESVKQFGVTSAEALSGSTAAMLFIVDELIATGVIDRNHLILVLEKHAERAEESKQSGVHRAALDALLSGLRRLGEPPTTAR